MKHPNAGSALILHSVPTVKLLPIVENHNAQIQLWYSTQTERLTTTGCGNFIIVCNIILIVNCLLWYNNVDADAVIIKVAWLWWGVT